MRWGVAIGCAVLMPVGAHATDILVAVAPVSSARGSLRLAVCTEAEYPTQRCRYHMSIAARPPAMSVLITGIAPGRYAVLAHHDSNNDGRVDTNFLGIPVEGVGVSRNATGFLGRPGFGEVAVDIAGERVSLSITLRQEPDG